MKIIYYYQTFVGLEKLKTSNSTTNLIISSIHFGDNLLYLNDNIPDDPKFNQLWKETQELSKSNVHISCMVGGAGGAFKEMFLNFDVYYNKLKEFLCLKPWIQGINLDVEEIVKMEDIIKLIKLIRSDFGDKFLITMAPIASCMENDIPGMGGFIYKELYKSEVGNMISWFNCQCYDSFSLETYQNIINNGYPEDKIVMGMISGQFSDNSFVKIVHDVKEKYNDVCGFYDWEYFNAPPNKDDPSQWSKLIKNA